jgi:hypothetical protein
MPRWRADGSILLLRLEKGRCWTCSVHSMQYAAVIAAPIWSGADKLAEEPFWNGESVDCSLPVAQVVRDIRVDPLRSRQWRAGTCGGTRAPDPIIIEPPASRIIVVARAIVAHTTIPELMNLASDILLSLLSMQTKPWRVCVNIDSSIGNGLHRKGCPARARTHRSMAHTVRYEIKVGVKWASLKQTCAEGSERAAQGYPPSGFAADQPSPAKISGFCASEEHQCLTSRKEARRIILLAALMSEWYDVATQDGVGRRQANAVNPCILTS